jgi:putative flippase GtrA
VIDRFCQFVAKITGFNRFVLGPDFSSRRNRLARFLLAGGINTLFGFVVYSAFIIAGMPVWLSLLASMFLGTIFNFFSTGGYAFREISYSKFPHFVICHLFIYGVNLMLIDLVFVWLDNKIMSQAILVFPMAMLSYFLMMRFVFFTKHHSF